MCASGFLCDEGARLSTLFMIFREHKKKMENEKKHHSTEDESSSEQQFRRSDVITFLCEKYGAILL